jgi:redox-sensitive bicupin YhaK (pirin superfamily)
MNNHSMILMSLAPVSHDLGGFKVHRTLPHKQRTMVGPFIFFDQMGPARLGVDEGIDVRPHPHSTASRPGSRCPGPRRSSIPRSSIRPPTACR